MIRRSVVAALLTLAIGFGGAPPGAAAEVSELKVALQFGIGYLPLAIMKHNKLIEKHLQAAGMPETRVTWSRLGAGAPMNDALLSGSLHIASGGVPPFLFLWGRTVDTLKVKAVAALCSMPMFLVTRNPNVKSIRDLTDKDRISVAGAGSSIQTIVLQMAAAREFGEANYNRLGTLLVNLPHPEGLATLLSGKEVTAYISSPPFQYQALEKPGIRKVLSSYDVMGGPATFLVVWTTSKFREDNPRTYRAFFNAFKEATDFVNANKRAAAEIYVKESGDKGGVDAIAKMLNDPEIKITLAPENVMKYLEFMNKVGTLKQKAGSWKDLFFPEAHNLPGS